jgi:hypothetical protein
VLEEAELARSLDGLGARGGTQLAEDRARMRLHGVEGDVELAGDFALRELACEQPQNGEFALGELPERRSVASLVTSRSQAKRSLGLLDACACELVRISQRFYDRARV